MGSEWLLLVLWPVYLVARWHVSWCVRRINQGMPKVHRGPWKRDAYECQKCSHVVGGREWYDYYLGDPCPRCAGKLWYRTGKGQEPIACRKVYITQAGPNWPYRKITKFIGYEWADEVQEKEDQLSAQFEKEQAELLRAAEPEKPVIKVVSERKMTQVKPTQCPLQLMVYPDLNVRKEHQGE